MSTENPATYLAGIKKAAAAEARETDRAIRARRRQAAKASAEEARRLRHIRQEIIGRDEWDAALALADYNAAKIYAGHLRRAYLTRLREVLSAEGKDVAAISAEIAKLGQ